MSQLRVGFSCYKGKLVGRLQIHILDIIHFILGKGDMFPENILLRFIGLFGIVFVMIGIFALIVWRGSAMIGMSLSARTIIFLSMGLILFMVASMAMGSLPWKWAAILGAVMLWVIYILWILSPLLIIVDIIGIWYKIPVIAFTVAAVIWVGAGFYYGNISKITPLSISSSNISKDHKIVFISDLHIEVIRNRGYVQSIVNQIQEIQPDFVLIGGDLMNTAKVDYVSAFEPFNQLTMPVYATLGNHDHMGDANAIPGIFETTKIIPLRNQSIDLDGIQIVGIDDKTYRNGKSLTGVLDEAKIASGAQFTILISHQPQKLSKLENYPIDLELAGHTHQGQFVPLSWIIGLFNDYAYGRYDEYGKIAFVSQGVGTWGAPIRIGTQSEIVLITLQKK